MIDRVAIYEDILRRNALRRGAGLPEWPVRKTYDSFCQTASFSKFSRELGARIRANVLADQQARYGADWPTSGGGRMAYSCLVAKALAESFHARRAT